MTLAVPDTSFTFTRGGRSGAGSRSLGESHVPHTRRGESERGRGRRKRGEDGGEENGEVKRRERERKREGGRERGETEREMGSERETDR